jgi:hypothetical protein
MQYTLRNVPKNVDKALREQAQRAGKSLNEVALDALARGAGVEPEPVPRRDLSDIAGSWIRDAQVERALEEQRTIDPDLWK